MTHYDETEALLRSNNDIDRTYEEPPTKSTVDSDSWDEEKGDGRVDMKMYSETETSEDKNFDNRIYETISVASPISGAYNEMKGSLDQIALHVNDNGGINNRIGTTDDARQIVQDNMNCFIEEHCGSVQNNANTDITKYEYEHLKKYRDNHKYTLLTIPNMEAILTEMSRPAEEDVSKSIQDDHESDTSETDAEDGDVDSDYVK